jgi:hypothetical protein
MILSAHQPAYLPWVGYFNKIINSDIFIVMDSVQFEKNSYINRNQIVSPQGPIWLTVPVYTKDYKEKIINEIEIQNTFDWGKKQWNSIYLNYKKSPYFPQYSEYIHPLFNTSFNYLGEYLRFQLDIFKDILNIRTKILYLSELNVNSKKQELVKDMCLISECNTFLFGSMGKQYAEKEYFDAFNINIKFQESKPNINAFSILDILFTQGIDSLNKQINENFSFSSPS